MSLDKTARLRAAYTGEPYSVALQWYRGRGLFNGLVPEAQAPQQQMLESCLLRALARPAPSGLSHIVSPGTVFGLTGVTPDVDMLLLRPAGDLVAQVLARILPSATTAAAVVGVPGLRAQVSPRTGLTVGRISERAVVGIHLSRTAGARAALQDLEMAAEIAVAAGLTPLWTAAGFAEGESQAWQLLREKNADAPVWSTALRRIGLFLDRVPDWTRRAPTANEVAGPKLQRIRARPVGPGSRVKGVVAVVSGSGQGGLGCSTTALALAGAFARGGSTVGVLAGQDPNGILATRRRAVVATADGWCDVMAVEGGGSVRAAEVSSGADAREMIRQARAMFDIVIADAGHALQHPEWIDFADVTVALAPYRRAIWTAERRLIDRRPDHVRFFAWLDEAFDRFNRDGGRPMEPLEKLLAFLDEEFLFYVSDREEDGNPAVYDLSDPQDIVDWWSTYALADGIGPREEDDDPDLWLPDEDEVSYLDQWRADFLSFLNDEGLRRHGDVWVQARTRWPAHSKDRNLKELRPGERQDATILPEFAITAEAAAIATWGSEMWQSQYPVWEAARETGDDLLGPWTHLLEIVDLPYGPREIAAQLRLGMRDQPDKPTVVALARAEDMLGADRLTAVRDALMDDGYGGLVVLPELRAFAGLLYEVDRLADRAGEAAGVANRLAHVVVKNLRESARASGDCD
ncbi:hypothetical protein [Embleya sp. MST-111070]|uniref:hypothetical protein n=1 Tax=Embleya sp. MST-111070 TaxID=3398231 RepID=UPI003F740FBF